jgi:cytochrome c oxidase subunit IV
MSPNPIQGWLRPCTRIWLFLMALTLLALAIGRLDLGETSLMLVLLVSTLWKGQLIADYFMALRYARPLWRLLVWGWLALVAGGVSLAYVLAA